MANLKDVVFLSNDNFEALASNGTLTVDGVTLTYGDNNLYFTPDTNATTSEAGLMSAADKSKLDGIQAGAQVNPSDYLKTASVSGDTLTLTKQDNTTVPFTANGVNLINVTCPTLTTVGSISSGSTTTTETEYNKAVNTAKDCIVILDVSGEGKYLIYRKLVADGHGKFVTFLDYEAEMAIYVDIYQDGSTYKVDIATYLPNFISGNDASGGRTALGLGTAATKNTGTGSGNIPVLDSSGKLADSVIPNLAITDVHEAASEAAMLALTTAKRGDLCIRSDVSKTFILTVDDGGATLSNWKEIKAPIPSGVLTGIKLNNNSITASSGVVTINTVTDYNASSNKLATAAEIPNVIELSSSGTSGTLSTDNKTRVTTYPEKVIFKRGGYYYYAENLSSSTKWYWSCPVWYNGNIIRKRVIEITTASGAWAYSEYDYSPSFTDNDTKDTTGGDNKASTKLFLVGMESQTTNDGDSRTYTNVNVYIGTDNKLYSNGAEVVTTGDSRLSDARTPTSHSHGNINNSGQITAAESTTTNVKHIAVCVDDSGTVKKMTPANVRTAIGAGTGNGTVTQVATSGTGLSGGTITGTGTITLDSSSAGNAAANKVVIRNAAGSIQSEKFAVSSGTTTQATIQYNSSTGCLEIVC